MTDRLAEGSPLPSVRHERRPAIRRFLPLLLLIAGLALAYAFGLHRFLSFDYLADSRAWLAGEVGEHPVTAPILFLAIYALAVALSLPAASILSIFGGFLFGWLGGAVLVAVAATLGATAVFLAARSAFGDILRRKLGGRLKNLAAGFEKDAFNYLLALRLAPIFPFFVVNVAPAFLNVPLSTFVFATAIGILPGVLAFTFLGAGLDGALAAAHAAGRDVGIGDLLTREVTLAFLALAVISLIPVAVRKLRRARP